MSWPPPFVPADRDLNRVERELHSRFLALQADCVDAGCPIFATEGMRTRARQAYLWAQGRNEAGEIVEPHLVVTHAMPGQSLHETGRALDFAFDVPKLQSIWVGPWEKVGAMAEKLGLVWGGRWTHPDRPHLQLKEGA